MILQSDNKKSKTNLKSLKNRKDRKTKSRNQTLPKTQRLNQILSLAGLTSRRKADEWIKQGRVMLNDHVIREPGIKAVWGRDSIKVDGDEITNPTDRTYLMINKPFGYICTLNDPEGRPVVTDLITDIPERIYPVGRLDFDSLGLLLLTNDGEWAHRLSHPRFKVPKTYKITIKGGLSSDDLEWLKKGVTLEDGFVKPSKVTPLKRGNDQELLRITLTSGKSRVIRRLFEHLGHRVIHLIRIGYGNLSLGSLKIGQYRLLEPDEVEGLKRMVGLK